MTRMNFAGLLKPEYLFRPNQILRKLWAELHGRRREIKIAQLPWGLRIEVNTGESIGWSVYTRGLYETAVTESLWRLARAGDLVIDVGTNIGYMASVLAVKVGARGKVYCFEPHPVIFERLRENVEDWRTDKRCGQFVLFKVALGECKGVGQLCVPDYFPSNQGTAWISPKEAKLNGQTLEVDMLALDDLTFDRESIGVVKLDVQGYELSVLKGLEKLLRERRIRHIVFEDEGEFPAATHAFLATLGYEIYGIEQRFRGIRFVRNKKPDCDPVNGPSPNFLATIVSESELKSLERGLWQSFGPLPFFRRLAGGEK